MIFDARICSRSLPPSPSGALKGSAEEASTRLALHARTPREHLHQVLALALRDIGVALAALAGRLSRMPLPEVELRAGLF